MLHLQRKKELRKPKKGIDRYPATADGMADILDDYTPESFKERWLDE